MQHGRTGGCGRCFPHLAAALIMACGWSVRAQTPERESPPFQIKVDTNVVMVRVVVRDGQRRPIAGLRKQDFHLSDNGKPQEIAGFTIETSAVKDPSSETLQPPAALNPPPAAAASVPQRFVALYFDDLHMDTGAIGQTRNAAWRYISTRLEPNVRAAIFTSSNQNSLEFTGDRTRLHDALFRLAPHARTNPESGQCPAIGEYQAFLIARRQRTDMLEIAEAEGYHCHCETVNETAECARAEHINAEMVASQIWDLADAQSQDALEVLEGAVRILAARPGQRSLVLVSSGFLMATRERAVDMLIDRALRRNIMVNAIDAAGLYTKAYHDLLLAGRPDLETRKFQMENEGLTVQRDVLAAIAEGTGGAFFHNNNDFDEAMHKAAQPPEVCYVLSFSPHDVKLNGSFHKLTVTLITGGPFDIQARRGYFASAPLTDKAAAKNELESALYSQGEMRDLPASVTAVVEKAAGDALTVMVKIHVDIQPLPFRKEGSRNMDTLIFNTALFDSDGKYVQGKESSLDFRVTDAKLEELLKSGINAHTIFSVAPGTYRLREVVRDTESKKMAAVSCNVEAQ